MREWDRVALRNSDLTYNKVSRAELAQMAGDFPLSTVLSQIGLDDAPYFSVAQIPPSAEEAEQVYARTKARLLGDH